MNPDLAIALATQLARAVDAFAGLSRGLSLTCDDIGASLRNDPLGGHGAASAYFGSGDPIGGLREAARGADELHRLCRELRDDVVRDYLGRHAGADTGPVAPVGPGDQGGHRPGPGFYPPLGPTGTNRLPTQGT